MSTVKSLWGDLPLAEAIRTPVVILREQATKLTELTSGILQGEVETAKDGSGNLYHSLRIVAPALDGYTYGLLRISHGVLVYPTSIRDEVNNKTYRCDSEGEFVQDTEEILSSSAVHRAVGALLAQSKAERAAIGL